MFKYIQTLYYNPATEADHLVKNYPALNTVRGMLVILIIITHALPESMTLYFLYMFHMPVFLGISGFLLKEAAFKNGFVAYLKKISKRLIFPWLVAFAIYLPLQVDKLMHGNPLEVILYPFYHLWYIPAYILGSAVCFAISRFSLPAVPVIIATLAITVAWYVFFRDVHVVNQRPPLYWLGDKRLYSYLFFYVFGYSLRNAKLHLPLSPAVALFIILSSFLLIAVCVFQHAPDYMTVFPYIFFNVGLIAFILFFIAHRPILQHKYLLFFNTNSLGIYFYHPMLLIIVYTLLGDPLKERTSTLNGLLIGLGVVALCFPVIWLQKQTGFTRKYMLGVVSEPTTEKVKA